MADSPKIYYHGTETRNAYPIMTGGFKLGEISHGRRLGRGLYISTRPDSAVFWSHFITIKCTMQPGTRILWIKEGYDPQIIRQLRREFGQEILELAPLSAHWMVTDEVGDFVRLSPAIPLDELKTISAKDQEEHLRDLAEDDSP